MTGSTSDASSISGTNQSGRGKTGLCQQRTKRLRLTTARQESGGWGLTVSDYLFYPRGSPVGFRSWGSGVGDSLTTELPRLEGFRSRQPGGKPLGSEL